IFACLVLLLGGIPTTGQVLDPASLRYTSTRRHLTTITTSEGPNGLRITIGTSSSVDDAIGYRSGDNYVVIVPQAEMSSLQIDMRLLNKLRIEKRDEDVALSFNLEAGRKAQLSYEENLIVITLTQSEEIAIAASGVAVVPGTTSAPSIAATSTALVSTPNPVKAAPQTLPSLWDIFLQTRPIDVANLDLSTPESPAFTVLGLTPQTIVRPASPKEFASSLINGLDKNGNFQSGLAIDTAPYLLFNGQNVTLDSYNRDLLTRLLTRTQFSVAAVKGSSEEDPSTKLSLGLNFTLFDNGDPRIYRPGQDGDVLSCFNEKIIFNMPPVSPLPRETYYERGREAVEDYMRTNGDSIKAIAEECREEGRKKHWNKTSWNLAFAPSWLSKKGNTSEFKWNGGAVWSSYALGVGNSGQFILHGRFRAKEQVPDEDNEGSSITQNSALFGGRFRIGSPGIGFNIEGAFVHNRPENRPAKNTYEFSLGLEKKLAPSVYFVITAGSQGPPTDGAKSKGFVITSFKYGFSKKPKFTIE
ncbi:MAG TPA: hypothetical protein VFM05_14480, partial [Candidatus Saccharimonadales bacterium]|nr:hypothetical protein [Candidatus Saccharimonadales bacterium]